MCMVKRIDFHSGTKY